MKRRHFLSTTLATSSGWIIANSQGSEVYQPPEDETIRVSILHTTDLHGHILPTKNYDGADNLGGLGRCVTQIRKWRKSNENHLTLDIGDLYQGTHVSLESDGQLMVSLLNIANYDGWVAGNHDFDWGEKVFRSAVSDSDMPVLSANLSVDGYPAGNEHHARSPYSNLAPTLLKEVGGIKIGVVGITTPGLPFWLNPGQLGSVTALDPLKETKGAIKSLRAQGAECIIAAGHMGLKRLDVDDYANQVNRIIKGCPEIDLFIAGHTHRERPSTLIGNTLFTQAGYHGIWAGRVELTFLKSDKQLIRRDAETTIMDQRIKIDPLVIKLSSEAIDKSDKALAEKVGKLNIQLQEGHYGDETLDTQALIAAGISHVLGKRGEKLQGVLHGAFSKDVIEVGEKTLADMWAIVPYENRIVTAEITGEQLVAILEEAFTKGFGKRRLVGFELEANWDRKARIRQVTGLKGPNGKPVASSDIFRIAFNSYDAQSGGRSMLLLREILLKAEAKTVYHKIDTRDALTDFFLDEQNITRTVIEQKIKFP